MRDRAEISRAQAGKERAAADEQEARARREAAEADERARVAERQRARADRQAERAARIDPDRRRGGLFRRRGRKSQPEGEGEPTHR
jgi:septal ring factor EnvC (AmiA/AmiB activator)